MSKKVVLTMSNGQQISFDNLDDLGIVNEAINKRETLHVLNGAVVNTSHIMFALLEEQ